MSALLGVVIAAAVLASAVAMPRPADAHAVLVRSSPESQAELRTPPASIDLWFSEPLEPEFSSFELFSSVGAVLPIDGLRIDPADDRHLSGLTRGLRPGIYTVVFQTLSTRDGHEWNGSFTFTVLNEDGSRPIGGAFEPDIGRGASAPRIVGRWLTFVGFAVLLGGGLVWVLLTRWPWQPDGRLLPRIATRLYRRLAVASLPLVVGGMALQLESQRDLLGGSYGDLLSESRFGTLLLWRALAVFAMASATVLAFIAAKRGRVRLERAATALVPALAAAGLVTAALLSHAAAAPGSFWAVLADLLHIEIAAAWAGGLVALGALLFVVWRHPRRDEISLLRPLGRFSVFAAAGVYLLATSGVLRALGELPTADALYESEYGRWLLLKLALLVPVLAIALGNRSILGRWSRGEIDEATARRQFAALLPLEAALAVAILGVVAVLGQVPTPRGEEQPTASAIAIPYNRIEVVADLNVHLQITPATVGPNELRVHVYRPDSSDPGPIQRVQISLAAQGLGGGDDLRAEPRGEGIFTASGVLSGASSVWNVAVEIRRTGFDDVRAAFDVPIEAGVPDANDGGAYGSIAPQLSSNAIWALLLVAGGLGLLIWQRKTRAPHGKVARVAGLGAVVVAVVLAVSADQHGGGTPALVNPSPGDPLSVERGRTLYSANCTSCHGVAGRGDGPAAATLSPPPVDLTVHVPLHPESDTYVFIARGFPGTAMPAWDEQLTDEQIWDLVNFLRTEFGERSNP